MTNTTYKLFGSDDFYLEYNPYNCKMKIVNNDFQYNFSEKSLPSVTVKTGKNEAKILFSDADDIFIRKYEVPDGSELRVCYSGFYLNGSALQIKVDILIRLYKWNNSVSFELEVTGDEKGLVRKVNFPQSIQFNSNDAEAYTVLPMKQGTLIPAKWKNTVVSCDDCHYFEPEAYMPWYGQVFSGNAYQCICETPWDAGYELKHTPYGDTSVSNAWYPSLGSMSYRRRCTYYFFANADYNDLCANYRTYVEENGTFLTLRDKNNRNPLLGERIGLPLVHDYVHLHIENDSTMYHKLVPDLNEKTVTFDKRWEDLTALRSKGVDRVVIHLDGIGDKGYDNGHPDILPINQKIGGEEGMRRFAKNCRDHSIPFDIHDQYRDFYHNAKSYREYQAVYDEHQNLPLLNIWQGGNQSILCATQAADYLRKNLDGFKKENLDFDGIHFGSFSGNHIDECFNPLHPMTKRECIEKRNQAFSLAHRRGYVVSSDEPVDCFINELDSVSHAPYLLSPSQWNGIGNGIPVPLFNLVYHDAILIYWNDFPTSFGSWGIPNNDHAFAHAVLNGNPVYLNIEADEEAVKACCEICEISRELAFEKMLKHEFVNGNTRLQRTTFSNGTVIEVDFNKNTWKCIKK